MRPETLDLLVTCAGVGLIGWLAAVAALALPWSDPDRAEVHTAVQAVPELPRAFGLLLARALGLLLARALRFEVAGGLAPARVRAAHPGEAAIFAPAPSAR